MAKKSKRPHWDGSDAAFQRLHEAWSRHAERLERERRLLAARRPVCCDRWQAMDAVKCRTCGKPVAPPRLVLEGVCEAV